ncbi:MAG: M14 family zinc carboxypeptidase [Gemmatimonadota bacterium]|nr:M14 family zinc carboxypeptidase [Gemmatimonadota bacterium]
MTRVLAAHAALIAGALIASTAAAQTPWSERLAIAEKHKVAAITTRRFTQAQLWRAIQPSLTSPKFAVKEVGKSMQGRPLRTITFGRGPVKVFMWSQMHGNEATATMALADMFAFLASSEPSALRDRIESDLTVTFLPMLNPDGAEIFQRENAAGIDINRDVRRLSTPEGRTLKAVRDAIVPDFGFNLHDQNARTRVGNGLPAAIALLPPAADEPKTYNEVRTRARLVAAWLADDFNNVVRGRIAKYDDTFNARAFGDAMQAWGASTVLIESGALPNDPQKMLLRTYNAAAMLGVLEAIAMKTYERANPNSYESLPFNRGGAYDMLIVGGTVVTPAGVTKEDVAINFDDSVARTSGRLAEMGDLEGVIALDTLDLSGKFLHVAPANGLTRAGKYWLPLGTPAVFTVRESEKATSKVLRRIP